MENLTNNKPSVEAGGLWLKEDGRPETEDGSFDYSFDFVQDPLRTVRLSRFIIIC